MTNHLRLRAAVCLLSCLWGVPLAAQTVEHPLDPLSFQEYWTVLETLKDAGRLDDGTRFSIVNLWVREASSPRTESEGMLHMSMEKPAIRPSTCPADRRSGLQVTRDWLTPGLLGGRRASRCRSPRFH